MSSSFERSRYFQEENGTWASGEMLLDISGSADAKGACAGTMCTGI